MDAELEAVLAMTPDLTTLRPSVATGVLVANYGRRVAGRNLGVWYRATRMQVELVGLTTSALPPS